MKKDFLRTSVVLGERVFYVLVNFVLFTFLTRYLGPSDFGKLIFLLAIYRIFDTVAQFGVDALFQKVIRRNPSLRNFSDALQVRRWSSLAAILLLAIFAFFWMETGERAVLLYFSAAFLFKHWDLNEALLLANFKHLWCALARLLTTLCFATAQMLAIWLDAGFDVIVLTFVLENTLRPIFFLLAVRRFRLLDTLKRDESSGDLKFSALIPLALTAMVGVLFNRQDLLVVEHNLSSAHLGVYAIGVRLQNVFIHFPTSVVNALYPRMLALEPEPKRLRRSVVQIGAILFYPAVIFSLIVSLHSKTIVAILGGAEFTELGYHLGIYIWSIPLFSLSALQARLYLMKDREMHNFINASISLVFAFICYSLLIGPYGLKGVAIGYLATRIAKTILIPALVPKQRFFLPYFRDILFAPLTETRRLMRNHWRKPSI